jgi:PAS domain S-box-containing protein
MNLDEDNTWQDTPLLTNLRAKGFICLPILLENNPVAGVLALSHEPLPALTDAERAVFFQIVHQVSNILQNIRLLTETRSRLREVNLLLDFSRKLSGLDPRGIVAALLDNALRVITNAHAGAVLLWDEHESLLLPAAAQNYINNDSLMEITYQRGEALPGKTFEAGQPRRVAEVNFAQDYKLPAEHLLRYRKATGGRLPVSSLLVPIQTVEQALGLLVLDNFNTSAAFTPEDEALLLSLTQQVALALENVRLMQATVSRAEQLATINQASYEIGLSLEPEEVYTAIHRATSQLMPVKSFVISLLDEEQGDIEGVCLMDPSGRSPNQRLPLRQGLTGRVIASGQPLLIPDAEQVAALGGKTFGEGQPRSIVAVPITMSGKVIGMLSAQSYQPNVYTEDEQQILSTLANQAAVAIQNGRLFAETRRLAAELEQRVDERTAELEREKHNTETLLRVLSEVSASLDLDRALNRTLALLNEVIGAEQGSILLVNAEDNTIHYRAGYGEKMPSTIGGTKPTALKIGEGLAGWVIKNRQAVLITDVRKDKRWVELPIKSSYRRSVIAAPLLVGEDVIGVIMVFHRTVGYFTPEHTNTVQAIGSQVSVAINNAQLYELIRDQAERLGSMLRNQQVEASRQQAILEAVADGVLVTDANNEINFVNSSAGRILSLKAETTIGQSLDNFVGLFGKATQAWTQTIRAWSEAPTSYQPGDTYAEQLTLENERFVLVHLAPVIWRSEFLGTVSIFRDITHEVEVDRLKSEFVATVSHELRTPMTSIKGYADLLLMGAAGVLNEKQTNFLEIVSSNTERLSILVNDLLDLSRIEAGRVSLSLQPLDLREIAESAMGEVARRSQVEKREMGLKLDSPPDLPRVYGDLERVHQILSNLLDNAYSYTPEKGHIIVHLEKVEGEIQVDVMDDGVGIAPGDQGRIFERFFRGENPLVLATPGTGLGLPIVKQLVNMHKGRIWMESTGIAGEGSTFSFTLPLYQAKE